MSEIHLCIATGQNAANLIPVKQLKAQEVWILETATMKALHSGADLKTALQPFVPGLKCVNFDDASPQSLYSGAKKLANELHFRASAVLPQLCHSAWC